MMKTLLAVLLSSSAFLANAHIFSNDEFEKVETKTLSLPASSLDNFSIEAGAGSLTIIGHNNNVIEVTADIYQNEVGAKYCLSLAPKSSDDSKAKLKANSCENNNHTKINLAVYVPNQLLTDVSDGSGPINISEASVTVINDGSGEIKVADNLTALTINDGSGQIDVNNQKGKLVINDGSGSVEVKGVEGDVRISDGSGSIDVADVAGQVSVSDGSGSISVDNAYNFELLSDGSGSVNVSNVERRK